jgi:AbiV family abortive infection protein
MMRADGSQMPKKPLTQFSGKRSPVEIADGINAAIENSKRLLDDADLLAKAARLPTACALAILSIEESGKPSVLRRLALAKTDADAKPIWRDYRSHQAKNAAWIITKLVAQGARTLKDLSGIYDPDSNHPAILDTIKQMAFYTDCYEAGHWAKPHESIDEKLWQEIRLAAHVLLPKYSVTAREVELWIEHVGRDQSEAGLRSYFRALQAEGFSPPEENDAMERFLGIKAH